MPAGTGTDAAIMTVTGPVPANELGATLPHEHLFIDLSCYLIDPPDASLESPIRMETLDDVRRSPYANRENCVLDDLELAVTEAGEFRDLGGTTIVDVTPAEVGRDPLALRAVSQRTGLWIVTSCGHYIQAAHTGALRAESEDTIAERFVREIRDGIDDTGIRPGIIGEIGTGDPITDSELKILRAAAKAHRETGLPITVHVHPPARRGHEVLDVLEAAGADLTRVVLGHCDASLVHPDISFDEGVAHHRSLAKRGCFVEYDLCGNAGHFSTDTHSWWLPSDRERIHAIASLAESGFLGSVLLSQDVGHKHYLRRYGGWGYGHILRTFPGHLRAVGFTDADVDQITVGNPRRMLSGC